MDAVVGTLWEHISRVLWLSCLRKSTAFLKLVMTKACKETPFSEQPQNASWITNSLTIHTRWNSTLRVMNFLQGYSDIFLDSCNHSCMHHSTLYYPCDHFPINGLLYHLKYEVKLLSRVWLFGTPWIVLPGSSVHGIFQARVLEWVAIFFSRGSSWPRDWTWVSRIVGRCFTVWATREAHYITWRALICSFSYLVCSYYISVNGICPVKVTHFSFNLHKTYIDDK